MRTGRPADSHVIRLTPVKLTFRWLRKLVWACQPQDRVYSLLDKGLLDPGDIGFEAYKGLSDQRASSLFQPFSAGQEYPPACRNHSAKSQRDDQC
jgi:hypothetical protein